LGQREFDSPEVLILKPNEVHLWVLHSAPPRIVLKEILGKYTGLSSGDLQLERSELGKPRLLSSQNPSSLFFNMSHSAGLVAVGVTHLGELGVDIEKLRPFKKMEQFLERFAFDSERKKIEDAPEHQKNQLFFEFWTAKEAWCKAHAKSVLHALRAYEWDPSDPGYHVIDGAPGYVGHLYLLR
jgi:4'-phosphopantetheinyl transferase